MNVVGAKIKEVRSMTDKEIENEGWDRGTVVLELDNGGKLFASMDEEGNDAGAMFGINPNGKGFGLI